MPATPRGPKTEITQASSVPRFTETVRKLAVCPVISLDVNSRVAFM